MTPPPAPGHTPAMRAALLDGSPRGPHDCRQALDALRRAVTDAGYEVTGFPLADLPLAPCRGCFACWTATPGRCPVEDSAALVARAVIGADLAVFFSPLSFGGWSSTLKKALDRMIGLVSPLFERAAPTRHRPRYARYPQFLAVGWTPDPDPEAGAVFARLTARNAHNLHAPARAAVVLDGTLDWTRQRQACLAALTELAR